eukprot:3526864-Rhodomonas_salina.1
MRPGRDCSRQGCDQRQGHDRTRRDVTMTSERRGRDHQARTTGRDRDVTMRPAGRDYTSQRRDYATGT